MNITITTPPEMHDQTQLHGGDYERPAPQRKPAEVRELLVKAIRYETSECTPATDEVGARAAFNAKLPGLLWEAKKIYRAKDGIERDERAILDRITDHPDFTPDDPVGFVERHWEKLVQHAASQPLEPPEGKVDDWLPLGHLNTWLVYAVLAFLRSIEMADTTIARELVLLRDASEFVEWLSEAFDDLEDAARAVTNAGEGQEALLALFFVQDRERVNGLLRILLDGIGGPNIDPV